MRRSAPWLMATSILIAACSGGGAGDLDGTVTGVVVAVEGNLQSVASFTIRGDDGSDHRFVPADGLRFDDGPLSHLQSHVVSGVPVTVEYRDDDGTLVATSVVDADPAEE